jgi:translation initiation factor 4A
MFTCPRWLNTVILDHQVDTSIQSTQVLVLSSTREIAQDVQKTLMALGKHMDIVCHLSIGGTNVREDMAKVREGVHVVTGTPGRVFDLINRRALRVDGIKQVCLNEADSMLSRDFQKQTNAGGQNRALSSVHQNP